MTNDQQGHPSSKANNHFTCGACSSGCGWDCAAAPEGRRNFLVSRACCTVYCNLPGCCFQLRTGAKKTHPGSMGGDEMPLRKIAASLAENPGFSCDCALAVCLGHTSAIYDKNPTYSDSRSPPALRPRKFERGPCFRSLRERRSPGEIPFSKSRHALGY
jgi:hypothetical protein